MARAPDPFEREMIAALPRLKRAALVWTRNPDAADDLVQETVIRAIAARDSYQLGTNMVGWLCFIARNQFISEKRRAWRSVTMPVFVSDAGGEVTLADLETVPASQCDSLELDDVMEALGYVTPVHADAVLAVAEGLSYEEAAEDLGVAVGTVKSRVARGRRELEAYFGLNISRETT